MITSLLFTVLIGYAYYWYYCFCEKREKLVNAFVQTETQTKTKIMYLNNGSILSYLFGPLNSYIINVDEEDTTNNFAKRLHKIKGNLILIIDFSKTDSEKIIPIIKALTAYSSLTDNTIATYVPYKSKDSASLLALAGKRIIMGNYATISTTITKFDPVLTKLLETYYGGSTAKKICDGFIQSGDQTNKTNCYTSDDLIKMKLNCTIEDKMKDGNFAKISPNECLIGTHYGKIADFDKDIFKNLMVEIEKFFS